MLFFLNFVLLAAEINDIIRADEAAVQHHTDAVSLRE